MEHHCSNSCSPRKNVDFFIIEGTHHVAIFQVLNEGMTTILVAGLAFETVLTVTQKTQLVLAILGVLEPELPTS